MKMRNRIDAMDPKEMAEFDIPNDLPSMTKQNFLNDNDPQTIFNTYSKTGRLPLGLAEPPKYGDQSNIPTFHEALNVIRKGEEAFMGLPAELRKKFNNDPGEYLAFIRNPDNIEEGEKIGLWKRPEPEKEKITKVEVVNPAPPSGEGAGVKK